jgi:hypothetical protein
MLGVVNYEMTYTNFIHCLSDQYLFSVGRKEQVICKTIECMNQLLNVKMWEAQYIQEVELDMWL